MHNAHDVPRNTSLSANTSLFAFFQTGSLNLWRGRGGFDEDVFNVDLSTLCIFGIQALSIGVGKGYHGTISSPRYVVENWLNLGSYGNIVKYFRLWIGYSNENACKDLIRELRRE